MPHPRPQLNRVLRGKLPSATSLRTSAALLFALVFLGVASARADTTNVVGTARGYPGTIATVPVTLRGASGVTAMQFDVTFDGNRVSSLPPEPGARLTNHVVKSREVAPGVRRVLVYSLDNAIMAGRSNIIGIGSLPFAVSVNERSTSGPLTPTSAILARPDATAVTPLFAQSGEIVVGPVNRNPDGTVNFFVPAQPGTNYVIEASTNLVDWLNLSTNQATGVWLDLMDADAVNYPWRFYRTRREP